MATSATNFLLSIPYYAEAGPAQLNDALTSMVDWTNQTPLMAMFAVGTTTAGTSFSQRETPKGTFLVQGGSDAVGCIGGTGTVTFPKPFPSGLISFTATSSLDGLFGVAVSISDTHLDHVGILCQDLQSGGGVGAVNGTITISWTALGW